MKRATKSRRKAPATVDLDSLIDDLAALKSDFATIVGQIRSGAVDHASERAELLLTQLSDRANALYDTVSEQGAQSVERVSDQVRARPLTSVLVAFGLGFIASRLILR
ncbi:MAG TPA: hypothetical protein VHA10_20080 [Hypericibacter adhaerens]|jgi:ElaB/YqjD/DUF883 family membrane-anchored ribosome-binding protein|uniref:DUF883 domain-containing protein n=1 Tax=Hypericibacter adhaerens TaxID=2602016 RepID=A0A5J6N1W3_9PROT|nr:hypothetical protein [Hypericibacter adhaerens]QEX23958.1 hypothetical protein FRZ61_38980 [Hypericibacter adhaerens]HWA45530.1 hypothetical protein [Hypericibacter adhaerens]